MAYEIIPSGLAIKAMRDSGYRDTAHAIAELVDNSIQAGASIVEVICTDKVEKVQQRTRRRVDEIAVYDNGHGMDAITLRMALQFGNGTHLVLEEQKGIGKFGMGLPNSSISQCERVDVWSWQGGKCLYSYLDVEDIQSGRMAEVPDPIQSTLPTKWKDLISDAIGKSGTLVVWSRADRVRWKTSKALLCNSSFIVGRMYRYFIHQNEVRIRLAALSPSAGSSWQIDYDETVKPNDPLYLMSGTSCPTLPAPFEHDVMFEEYGDPAQISVTLPSGEKHEVIIRYSIAKTRVRKKLGEGGTNPGATEPGKHAGRNIGVSVVRAGRELEMNQTFVIGYDPVERWWGIEVSFPPALDEIFGVTNNKQAATAFRQMDLTSDAAADGMTAGEYLDQLKSENDPRWPIYEISKRIHANLSAIRKQLSRTREGTRTRIVDQTDPAEVAATRATLARKQEGHVGQSDQAEELSAEERKEDLARAIEELGANEEEAREIAVQHVDAGIKYVFQETSYDGPSFFSIASRGGAIIVTLNSAHPAASYLYSLLEDSNENKANLALEALKVILCAWARMEDESQSDVLRQRLSDMRNDWGRMARDFLRTAFED